MTTYVHDGIRFTKGTDGKTIRVDDRCQPTRARGCQGSGPKRRATAKCAKRQAKASGWQSPLQGLSPPIGEPPAPDFAWPPTPPNAPATGGASSSSQGDTPPNAPATGGASSSQGGTPAPPNGAPATGGTPAPPNPAPPTASDSSAPATGGTPAQPERVSLARLRAAAAFGNPEGARRIAEALVRDRADHE